MGLAENLPVYKESYNLFTLIIKYSRNIPRDLKLLLGSLYFSNGFIEDNGMKLRYGEDSYFCKLCRDIGIDTWLLPWVNVKHIGELEYTCKLT